MIAHRHLVLGIPASVLDASCLGLTQLTASELIACPACGGEMYVPCLYARVIAQGTTRALCLSCAVPHAASLHRLIEPRH